MTVALIAASLLAFAVAPQLAFGADDPTDLPDGVLADGAIEITVLGEGDAPVEGAEVRVIVMLVEPPETGGGLAKVSAFTGPDGVVTITGLPRPDDGGPGISWDVFAEHRLETPIDGCTYVETRFGAISMTPAAGTTQATISMVAYEPEWINCADPGPGSPLISGHILDDEGQPFEVATASIEQSRPGGGAWFSQLAVDHEGRYETLIHPWGTAEGPSTVLIWASSAETRVIDGACYSVYATLGQASFQFALELGPPEIPTIYAETREIEFGCEPDDGAEGGLPPAAPTPPPTARLEIPSASRPDGALAATVLAGIAALILVFAAWPTVVRRRRSRRG